MRPIFTIALTFLLLSSAQAREICQEPGLIWFVNLAAVQQIDSIDRNSMRDAFDNCRTVVGGGFNTYAAKNSPLLNASKRAIFRSFKEFERVVSRKELADDITYVIYNPEPAFGETPPEEKRDPVKYGLLFAKLAKKNNLIAVAAPSCRLAEAKGNLKAKFYPCIEQILVPLASKFDVIDLQVQGFQSDTALYKEVVTAATKSIKKSSPHVKVVAQVTTSDEHNGNIKSISEALYSVSGIVDGFWINIDSTESGLQEGVTIIRDHLPKLKQTSN